MEQAWWERYGSFRLLRHSCPALGNIAIPHVFRIRRGRTLSPLRALAQLKFGNFLGPNPPYKVDIERCSRQPIVATRGCEDEVGRG